MHLYLMRHGIAMERHEFSGDDDQRPLTEEGIVRTRAVVEALKGKIEVTEVWTSPLVRARQTADIAAEVLGVPVKACESLACGASVEGVATFFARHRPPERVMLVGHEPDMSHLADELSKNGFDEPFKKAGIAYLKGGFEPGGMKLNWYQTPKDVLKE